MKTVFFRSPFFIVLLLLLACSQKKESVTEVELARKAVGQHTAAALDTASSNAIRITSADEALRIARNSGNDTLIAMASLTKASILDDKDGKLAFLLKYKQDALKRGDLLNLATSNAALAEYFKNIGKPDSTFYYYNESRINYEARNDSLNVVYKLIQIADIYRQYNDYVGVESASIEAIRFLNDPDDKTYNPTIYTNLGIAFKNLLEFDDAIHYYGLAAKIATDSLTIANTQNNIAVVHKLNGRLAEAEKILSRLLQSKIVNDAPATKGRILANLGHTLYSAGKPGGLELLLQSENERKRAGDSVGLVSTYIHLADANSKMDPSAALNYAQSAYQTATTQKSTDDRLEALKQIIKNAPADRIKPYTLAYMKIDDSITNVRQSARNRFAKIKYDATAASDENLQLKTDRAEKALEMERSRFFNIALALGMLLLVSVGYISYLVLKKSHRKKLVQQVYETETRIGKKVHDEFANDIYSTIAFSESEDLSVETKKEKLLQQLAGIYSRSRDIARENSPVTTDEKFPELLSQMLSEFNSANCKVILSGINNVPWHQSSDEAMVAVYRVLHELMVNMKKHSRATLVGIRFENEDGVIRISYTDNGIGMPQESPLTKNGLQNVENRINAIGGKITFESGPQKGLKVLITYKAKK